jgi:hypothetical protein
MLSQRCAALFPESPGCGRLIGYFERTVTPRNPRIMTTAFVLLQDSRSALGTALKHGLDHGAGFSPTSRIGHASVAQPDALCGAKAAKGHGLRNHHLHRPVPGKTQISFCLSSEQLNLDYHPSHGYSSTRRKDGRIQWRKMVRLQDRLLSEMAGISGVDVRVSQQDRSRNGLVLCWAAWQYLA